MISQETAKVVEEVKSESLAKEKSLKDKDGLIRELRSKVAAATKPTHSSSTQKKQQQLKFVGQTAPVVPPAPKDALSTELVQVSRELATLKLDHRHQTETLTKTAKQLADLQKQTQAKQEQLDKLRKERDSLAALASQDQFKTIKAVEASLHEVQQDNLALKKQNRTLSQENTRLESKCNEQTSALNSQE